MGLPTISDLPITTVCFPDVSTLYLFNNSIIPIGTLLSTRYFISLQLIGLIIVACVIGSIAVTKNTIENDNEGERETV